MHICGFLFLEQKKKGLAFSVFALAVFWRLFKDNETICEMLREIEILWVTG